MKSITTPAAATVQFLKAFMKAFIFLILLTYHVSCIKPADPPPSTLLLTIIGECTVEIRLFTPDGQELLRSWYDCQESSFARVETFYSGLLVVQARHQDRIEEKVFDFRSGRIIEGVIFF
jgi:hypothetical protein